MNAKIKNSARSLGIVIISMFGFLIILTFYTDGNKLEFTGQEMHEILKDEDYTIEKNELSSLSNPLIVSLDRKEQFLKTGSQGEYNIPLPEILSEDSKKLWENSSPKVIYAQNEAESYQAWVLLRQMGYTGIYVLAD